VFAALSQRLSQGFFVISNSASSDAPGTLPVTRIDAITQIVLESPLAAFHMAHGPLAHILYIVAGVLHILLAELADHWLVLSGAVAY
jgi:hypothetical protein